MYIIASSRDCHHLRGKTTTNMAIFCSLLLATALLSSAVAQLCGGTGGACAANDDCCAGLICSNGMCMTLCGGTGGACAANDDCCAGLTCSNGMCMAPETPERPSHVTNGCQTHYYLDPSLHESAVFDSLANCARDPSSTQPKYPNSADWLISVHNAQPDFEHSNFYYVNIVYDIDIESDPVCQWDRLTLGVNTGKPAAICGEQAGAFSVRMWGYGDMYRISFSSDSIINKRGFWLNISLSFSPDFDYDVTPQYTEPVNSFNSTYVAPSSYSYRGYTFSIDYHNAGNNNLNVNF